MNKPSYYCYWLSLLLLFGSKVSYTSDQLIALQSDSQNSGKSVEYKMVGRGSFDVSLSLKQKNALEDSLILIDQSKKNVAVISSSWQKIKKTSNQEISSKESLSVSKSSKTESFLHNPFFFNESLNIKKTKKDLKPEIAFTQSIFIPNNKELESEYSEPSHSSIIEEMLEKKESVFRESHLLKSTLNKAFLLSSNQNLIFSNANVRLPLKEERSLNSTSKEQPLENRESDSVNLNLQDSSSLKNSIPQHLSIIETQERLEQVVAKSAKTQQSEINKRKSTEQEELEKIEERERIFMHFFGGPSFEQADLKATEPIREPVVLSPQQSIFKRQVRCPCIVDYIKLKPGYSPAKLKIKRLIVNPTSKKIGGVPSSPEKIKKEKSFIQRSSTERFQRKEGEHPFISLLTSKKVRSIAPKPFRIHRKTFAEILKGEK